MSKMKIKKTIFSILILCLFYQVSYAVDLDLRVQKIVAKIQHKLLLNRKYTKIAINNFKVLGNDYKQYQIANKVMYLLETKLADVYNCDVIQIEYFNEYIKELQDRKLIRTNEFFKVCHDLGATAILTGVVFNNGLINISINDVPSGKLLFSDILNDNIYCNNYLNGAAYRSLLIPGFGQLYLNEKIKGSLIIVTEFSLVTTAILMAIKNNNASKKYRAATMPVDKLRYSTRLSNSHQAYLISVCAIFGIWAYSVIDAYTSYRNNSFSELINNDSKLNLSAINNGHEIVMKLQYNISLN